MKLLSKIKCSTLVISWIAACLLMVGCMPSPYYQQYETIPKYNWDYQFKPQFEFAITDTNSAYNIFFIIRHTNAYPYSNIWLKISTQTPADTVGQQSRIEIPLAEPNGKWLGRGMNEIWEQRMPLTRNGAPMIFSEQGTYRITLQHDMRKNPLPEIMQVGLRLEKTERPFQATGTQSQP